VVVDERHGPLPGLLLALTVLTGIVDAVSILSLGRVFVANMTGNVAFIGFALAGAPGFSLSASVFAIGGFLAGAGVGGSVATRITDRGRLFVAAAATELVLFGVALAVVLVVGDPISGRAADLVAALAALAMGVQNAVVRRLAVPDLTTTVLTMTMTGIAADVRSGTPMTTVARRVLAVLAMLAGAVLGAVLVLHASTGWAMAVAVLMLAAITAIGALTGLSREQPTWRAGR
jgi:uncharacterized membrane protein YoaK (UPF0700 family)